MMLVSWVGELLPTGQRPHYALSRYIELESFIINQWEEVEWPGTQSHGLVVIFFNSANIHQRMGFEFYYKIVHLIRSVTKIKAEICHRQI